MIYLIGLLMSLQRKKLGANNPFVPMPRWLNSFMDKWGYSIQQKVMVYARLSIGTDFSYLVDNEIACSEALCRLIKGIDSRQEIITGTWTLMEYLRKNPRFTEIFTPEKGCIILSPTGTGNGKIRGHVGIYQDKWTIHANSSESGKWGRTFSHGSWLTRYEKFGGISTLYFKFN